MGRLLGRHLDSVARHGQADGEPAARVAADHNRTAQPPHPVTNARQAGRTGTSGVPLGRRSGSYPVVADGDVAHRRGADQGDIHGRRAMRMPHDIRERFLHDSENRCRGCLVEYDVLGVRRHAELMRER